MRRGDQQLGRDEWSFANWGGGEAVQGAGDKMVGPNGASLTLPKPGLSKARLERGTKRKNKIK
jgi:hypothetical protein